MRVVKLLFIIAAALDFSHCKKTETPVKEPIVETNPQPDAVSKYDGLFVLTKIFYKNGESFALSKTQTDAYVSAQSILNEGVNPANFIDLGGVTTNLKQLKNQTDGKKFWYHDSSFTSHTSPVSWKISGSSKIDSFSFVNSRPYPTFQPDGLIDTIKISRGLNLNIKKANDCSLIRLFISAGNSYLNKFYKGDETTLVIGTEELKSMQAAGGFYTLTFYNDNYWNINKRTINFRNAISFANIAVQIKP